MASIFLKFTAILCFIFPFLLLSSTSKADQNSAFLYDDESEDINDDEYYTLDTPFSNLRTKYPVTKIRKGASCDAQSNNICDGVSANNGTSMLYCCKKHCRNILGDMNNCGQCQKKCKFGQRCCGGVCTDVVYNPLHCGKCNKACLPGVKCDFGYCGYA
ncbi:protein GRIM REAPER [Lycium barbarum]|uniref:protein GRIM REAPER n=1 Tax=Lycium barbarum TaxID=112863 RepID=UPI00293F1BA2|nr:protein GRIM REAPER [Lycium barbarum]